MSRLRSRTTAILAAAVVLVGGANLAAYAANGRPLLLGKVNTETRSATIKNTGAGPALKLKTRASAPPLAVNSRKKVTRLNADLVDGKNAADLQTVTKSYAIPPFAGDTLVLDLPGLRPGLYDASYSVFAVQPAGKALQCWFEDEDFNFSHLDLVDGVDDQYTVNASGLLDTRTDPVQFMCAATGDMVLYNQQSLLTFTRVDRRLSIAATPAPRQLPSRKAPGLG